MLLKVDRVNQHSSIRLVELMPEERHQYLALSYCWGPKAQRKTLTRATRAEFMGDGIRLEELDATIQDAVSVTRELGYLYLWIDALCIIQDDDDLRAGELGRMDDIYNNASITIVAARASSVSDGFLTPRQPAGASAPDKVFKVACKRPNEQLNMVDDWVILVPEEEEHWETPKEPWESRAWTVQEDLLSRRQLRFGAKQTSWVCYCSQKPYKDFDGWFGSDLQEARASRLLDKRVERLGGSCSSLTWSSPSTKHAGLGTDWWKFTHRGHCRFKTTVCPQFLPSLAAWPRFSGMNTVVEFGSRTRRGSSSGALEGQRTPPALKGQVIMGGANPLGLGRHKGAALSSQ